MTPDPNPIQVLHRDLSTQSQLGMLMSVSATMMNFIRVVEKTEEECGLTPHLTEGNIAAENTLVAACERIDSIIKDDKRWGLEFQTRIEELFNKNTELAREVAEGQKKLIDESLARERAQMEVVILSQKPHIVFRPRLFTMPDHTWIAFLGEPADLRSGIMGTGKSPVAALESFDNAFAGQLTPEQEQTIRSIQDEHETMDQSRTATTGESSYGGEDLPRDSEAPGP
jgi:hypothetical protein